MRRRRRGRCLLRADLAIEDGHFDEARRAITEAREIGGDTPEVIELEERLQASQTPSEPPPGTSLVAPLVVTCVGLALVGLSLVAGRSMWGDQIGAVAPAGPTPIQGSAARPPRIASPDRGSMLRISREIVRPRAVTPGFLQEEAEDPALPPRLGPPIARLQADPPLDPQPLPPPAAVVPAEVRTETPPAIVSPPSRSEARPDSTLAQRSSEPPGVRVPDPVPAAAPPPRPGDPDAVPAVAVSVPADRPPPAPEPTPPVDEAGVRAILQRYAVAYSRLDAAAASAVWPAVDRGALERAFGGLALQQVSLGDCAVRIDGAAARATCAGSATWQPKVGGRTRTEPRQWSFELRKAGEAWRIERAVARGGE